MAGIVVLVAALRLRVWGMLYTALISAALVALFLAVHCFRAARPRFDARLFFRMLRFAAPIGLSGIAMFLIHFGDRFVLPHYRSLAELGIYVLAYKIGMLLSVAYAAFQTYWSAQVFHIMRRDDAETVFARLFTYVILALSFGGLGLIVCSRPALRILVAPAFQGAAPVVPVIVIAYYIRSVGDYLRCLFLASGHPSYDAICNWAGAVVCLTGYLTLIPRFGMWGAAFATAAAFTVIGVLSVIWTYRLRPYRVEAGRLVKIGVALAAGAISYSFLPAPSLVAQIGLAALSLALFLLTLWLLRFPTSGELQAGRTVFQALARGESKVSAIYLVNL
jgi:O-antigen/teichoic acid export membrane protein